MFPQYEPNKQACVSEAEADYVYKQVKLSREISPINFSMKLYIAYIVVVMKMFDFTHIIQIISGRNPYKEMMINTLERHNIDQTNLEMYS